MEFFLRIETHSNILGSKDKDVTFISISQIISVRSDSDGGSIVVYSSGQEIAVPELSPDHLMSNCIQSYAPDGFDKDLSIVVNNS